MRKLLAFLLLACPLFSQVSVAPSPVPRIQFLDSNGRPLAGGRVFTYLAGTTTLENTYIDAGGIQQNTDPIILNSGGFASIWLANKSYKFIVQNSAGSTQWTADNITGYLGLLNLSNTWTFPQLFTQPITITPSDNQIILGASGSQTILDAPPSGGSTTLHFQTSSSDTVVNRASTDTLLNKTLTSPTIDSGVLTDPIINGVTVTNSPGTYLRIANDTSFGTSNQGVAKLTSSNPASATKATNTDTFGFIGIVVSGGNNSGTSIIQQSGTTNCTFDNATTAGDYVQVSTSNAPQCHDVGATKPTSGQIVGRVLSTNASGGVFLVDLYPPETMGVPVIYPKVVNRQSPSVISPASSFVTAGFNVGSVDATFRVSAFVRQKQTGVGCTGATSTNWTLTYTDVSGGTITPVMLTIKSDGSAGAANAIQIAATNGAVGNFVVSIPSFTFRAKAGTVYGISGTYTVGANCTTDPGFSADIIYEQLTAD